MTKEEQLKIDLKCAVDSLEATWKMVEGYKTAYDKLMEIVDVDDLTKITTQAALDAVYSISEQQVKNLTSILKDRLDE